MSGSSIFWPPVSSRERGATGPPGPTGSPGVLGITSVNATGATTALSLTDGILQAHAGTSSTPGVVIPTDQHLGTGKKTMGSAHVNDLYLDNFNSAIHFVNGTREIRLIGNANQGSSGSYRNIYLEDHGADRTLLLYDSSLVSRITLRKASEQKVSTGSPTVITFSNTGDPQITHDNGVFTINATGWWGITASVCWDTDTTGDRNIYLDIDDDYMDNYGFQVCPASANLVQHLSAYLWLDKSREIRLKVLQTSGDGVNVQGVDTVGPAATMISFSRIAS
jgi:hypothetical protein